MYPIKRYKDVADVQIPNSWHLIIHKLSVAHRNLHRLHTYREVQNTHTPIKTKDTKCVEKQLKINMFTMYTV